MDWCYICLLQVNKRIIGFIFSVASGYISSRFSKFFAGSHWSSNNTMTAMLFFLPLVSIILLLNLIAWFANSTSALPFSSIIYLVILVPLVAFTLMVLGSMSSKLSEDATNREIHDKNLKSNKVIPRIPYYHNPIFLALLGGLFPFR